MMLKPSRQLHRDGSCVLAWRLMMKAQRQPFCRWLGLACGERAWWAEQCCYGRPLGKGTETPTLSQVRLIVPQSPVLQVMDAVLSSRLLALQSSRWPHISGCYVGGAHGNQPGDVAAAASLLMERGRDAHSRVSVASSDIEKFYDSVSPLTVAARVRLLQSEQTSVTRKGDGASRSPTGLSACSTGCQPSWLSALMCAVVMFQLTVKIAIGTGQVLQQLGRRTCGTLTGSRCAGALGAVVVAMTLEAAVADPRFVAFDMGDTKLAFAVWIDNIFSVGMSEGAAVAAQGVFEAALQRIWRLKLKPESKEVVSVTGQRLPDAPPRGWRRVTTLPCLGHLVTADGALQPEWAACERSVWRRFWLGAGASRHRRLPFADRWRDVQRVCWPAIAFRCGKWP